MRPRQLTDIQYGIKIRADVKYHVPTGFGFSPKASGFYPFGDATDLVRGRRCCCGVSDFKQRLELSIPHHQRRPLRAVASPKG